ncbi:MULTISPECIES: hypothetical protein [unclassified Variovorax]|uniref:hypothetical protein n=1 Tax=unclassified Variovorax TaxID=663243 RepID=UPI001318597D|nr:MULTISPECIES: hypothetical protein [unclassified Variovorax]VTU43025.1 hypothetical protein SRS16P1_00418 [Variovorax sp. SRS16]VTU43056.1 hypothetical protein E5P1_00416 [Variovorax sp. PBL-E5]VTU43507.1 hypothetical protein H6P1_00488 [Variovorax sp. PBL-H6]
MKTIAALALLLCGAVHGQTVYRCGNTFSQVPCGEGQTSVYSKANGVNSNSGYADILANLDETKRKLATKIPDTNPPTPELLAANKAKCSAAARDMLKDPDSARMTETQRFGPAYDYHAGKTHPGVSYGLEINAKNSYGGYTGKKQWSCVFSPDEAQLVRVYQVTS